MTLVSRYCDTLCPVMVTQSLFLTCARFGSLFRRLRESARASWSYCSAVRAGCGVQRVEPGAWISNTWISLDLSDGLEIASL